MLFNIFKKKQTDTPQSQEDLTSEVIKSVKLNQNTQRRLDEAEEKLLLLIVDSDNAQRQIMRSYAIEHFAENNSVHGNVIRAIDRCIEKGW